VLKIDAAQCGTFEQYAPERLAAKDTPPAFIYHTTDDELVPVDASVTFYRALHAAGVPAEMHIFATGRHGSGLGLGDAALDAWPGLLETWLRARGLLPPLPPLPARPR
jgi:acetyl esterase/lipase